MFTYHVSLRKNIVAPFVALVKQNFVNEAIWREHKIYMIMLKMNKILNMWPQTSITVQRILLKYSRIN